MKPTTRQQTQALAILAVMLPPIQTRAEAVAYMTGTRITDLSRPWMIAAALFILREAGLLTDTPKD